MALVKTLRSQREMWKEKYRKETETRSTVHALHKTLETTTTENNKTLQLLAQQKDIATQLSRQLEDVQIQEQKARRDALQFRATVRANAMIQVNTSLKCQVVNCGYRKIALSHKQQIDDLKSSNGVLVNKITALVDAAKTAVMDTASKPRDQPKPMHSGFVLPLSLSALPDPADAKKSGGRDSKKRVKHWSLKRTLQELSPLLSSKVDSDRRCDSVKQRRHSLPEHFHSFYLKQEGTMTDALSMLGKVVHSIMHHLDPSSKKTHKKKGKKGKQNDTKDEELFQPSPMITIVTTALGLVRTNIYSARISHAMLGLMARLAVSEFGLQTTASVPCTEITVGSVLRVVIMKAALKGENSVRVGMTTAFRMIRYTFPLLAKHATCPDRLCLSLPIYEQLLLELCRLFEIENPVPFVNALRYEINKAVAKEKKEHALEQAKKFQIHDSKMDDSNGLSNGKATTARPKNKTNTTTNAVAAAAAGAGVTVPTAHHANATATTTAAVASDATADRSSDASETKDALVGSKKEARLLQRVHNLPKKTRKLLLTAASNKQTLKNLFEIFDEDGNGSIDGNELRIAMSNCGVQLNRKEAQRLMDAIDEDGDGELQFSEYLDFIEAVAKDEHLREKEIQKVAWQNSQQKMKKIRRDKKKKRALMRSMMVANATAALSATHMTGRGSSGSGSGSLHSSSTTQPAQISSIYTFVNGNTMDDSNDDSSDEEPTKDGLPMATLEDVAMEYTEERAKSTDPTHVEVKAPMFEIMLAALQFFVEQEEENATSVLTFYDTMTGNTNNLTFAEFMRLVEAMATSERILEEEMFELFSHAANLIPDDNRVNDKKFLMVMVSRGLIPSKLEIF